MSDEKVADYAQFEQADDKTYTEAHIDPALDAIITKKLDRHIVPWLFGLWLLAFIDRSNIGNARSKYFLIRTLKISLTDLLYSQRSRYRAQARRHEIQCCTCDLLCPLYLCRRPQQLGIEVFQSGLLPPCTPTFLGCSLSLHRLRQKLPWPSHCSLFPWVDRGRLARRDDNLSEHVLPPASASVPHRSLLLCCSPQRCIWRTSRDRTFEDPHQKLPRMVSFRV